MLAVSLCNQFGYRARSRSLKDNLAGLLRRLFLLTYRRLGRRSGGYQTVKKFATQQARHYTLAGIRHDKCQITVDTLPVPAAAGFGLSLNQGCR